MLSCVQLFVTPWTIAHKAPLSMGFPRQDLYWSGLHFLLQGIFPSQGSLEAIKIRLLTTEVIVAETEWSVDIVIGNEVREVEEGSDHVHSHGPLYVSEFKRLIQLLLGEWTI